MENKRFAEMTDEELLVEKKKLRQSKILNAVLIGFLIGVVVFGVAAWSLSPERQLGFLIPILFPVVFLFKLFKKPNPNQDLEEALKERKLS